MIDEKILLTKLEDCFSNSYDADDWNSAIACVIDMVCELPVVEPQGINPFKLLEGLNNLRCIRTNQDSDEYDWFVKLRHVIELIDEQYKEDNNMYDWQDKDGYAKLQKILKKLRKNGFNADMSNSKHFVVLYTPERKQICEAYSSSWHNCGLIEVEHLTTKIGSTFSADEAYDMMVNYYNQKTEVNHEII